MKIREIIAVAAIGLIASCDTPYEATDTTMVAPVSIRNSFSAQYPTATNVVWTNYDATIAVPLDWDMAGWTVMDTDDFVVRYNMGTDEYYSWYDSEGNWVGTAYVVTDLNALPTVITNTVNTQFPGYTISSVTREFQTDRMAYEVELKNETTKVKLLLDGNGNILKQKTKAND
jgi:hypothetical protein